MGKLGCIAKAVTSRVGQEAVGWMAGYGLSKALSGLFAGADEAASAPPPNDSKPAAAISHQTKHSSFWAALAGAVVGALISAAVTFAVAGLIGVTGGVGLLVIGVGVGIGLGSLIAGASSGVTNWIDSMMPANDGPIMLGSFDVFVGGLPAARATMDPVLCVKHNTPQLIADGSQSVYVNGLNAARLDGKTVCGSTIKQGVENVLFGGPPGRYLDIEDEFAWWEKGLIMAAEFLIPPGSGMANASKNIGRKIGSKLGSLGDNLAPALTNALRKGPAALNKASSFASDLGSKLSSKLPGKLGKGMSFGPCNAATNKNNSNKNRKKTSEGEGENCTNKNACESDPVDTSTGAVVDVQTDFSIGASFEFEFTRSYNSQRIERGWLGQGWRDSLSEHLMLSHGGEHIEYVGADGTLVPFNLAPGKLRVFNRRHPHYTLISERECIAIHDLRDDSTRRFELHADRGWLCSIEDAYGNGVHLEYEHSKLARVIHSDGAQLALRYAGNTDAEQTITIERVDREVVSPLAHYTLRQGLLVDANILPKERISYTYDAHRQRAGWNDHDGKTWVRYTYDEAGRCVSARAAEGLFSVDLSYDEATRTTHARNSRGAITAYEFDEQHRLVCKTDPLGGTTRWEYSRHGDLLSVTDALGHAQQFEYEPSLGVLLRHLDREGHATEYFYDDDLRVYAVIDALAQTWLYERGESGELLRAEAPDGSGFAYAHNPKGQVTGIERSDGATRTLEYDEHGRLIAESDWAGNSHRYTFDVRDRLSSVTDPSERREQLFWDPRDLLVSIVHPDRSQIALERDHAGLVSAVTDENGHTARREYGAFELLQAVSDAEGRRYELRYDPDHLELSELLAPDGRRYRFERDEAGRVVREIDYAGRATRYDHDAAGNRTVRINAAGQVTRYGYDKNGRLTCVEADGELTEFEHDPLGRLVRTKNNSSELEWEYDALGRVLRAVQNDETLEYTYDEAGRCIERELKPGPWQDLAHRTVYAHDENGRLTLLELESGALSFERDVRGNATSTGGDSGYTLEQRYDERGLLLDQELIVGEEREELRRQYAYDAAGNLIQVEDSHWGTTHYQLDRSDRILAATRERGRGEKFDYDTNGLLSRHRVTTRKQELDLLFESGPDGLPCRVGDTEYAFDAVGRLVRKTVTEDGWRPKTWTFRWDSRDRLLEARTPEGAIWRYAYDPLGRRVLKYNPGTRESVHFLWDGDVLLRELYLESKGAEGMEQAVRIVHWHHDPGTFRPLAREVEGELCLVVSDAIGTPVGLVGEGGEVAWRGRRSVWGAVTGQTRNREIDEVPIGFPGQYLDEESGLFYNRFRYYDSALGSYIGPDPIGIAGGFQQWKYVHNPNCSLDPLGLIACENPQRSAAFNQVKQDLGIPRNQQPDVVNRVKMTDRTGATVLTSDGKPIYTREYVYTRTDGSQVVVQDHSAGHIFNQGGIGDQGPHFNARPIENTRTGSVSGTQGHYPFNK